MTAAGPSRGFVAMTDTFVCTLCKVITDIKIGESQRPTVAMMRPEPRLQEPVCRECGKDESLIRWDVEKRPCPKCDGKMVKNEGVLTKGMAVAAASYSTTRLDRQLAV